MTHADKIALLEDWMASRVAIDEAFLALRLAVGDAGDESAVWKGLLNPYAHYTNALAKLLGDDMGHLDWFDTENDMGAKGFEANGKKRKTVEDLLDLIETKPKMVE